jgi:hypothetical protein
MGKKSLIKSTTKSKKGAKEKEETTTKNTKKAAPKKAAPKTAKKTAAKKTATTKKPAAKTTPKAAPKKAAPKKAAAKKTAPAKPKAAPKKTAAPKKVSIQELVFKKFEPLQTLPAQMPATKQAVSAVSAPPLITSADPKEVERLRAVLLRKFNMNEIKAAVKEPEPIPEPAPEPEAEPAAPAVESPREPAPAAAAATKPEPESAAYITVEPSEPNGGAEPMSLPVKIAIAAAATIVFLLLAISYNNSSKYYILPKDQAIEIWKGRFSPKDEAFYMVLHGAQAAEPVKEVYTRQEVFPLIFDYYINKADTLLEVPGLPDFDGIKGYLHQAENYALSQAMKTTASSRLNTIERMILLYKADVALSKDSQDSLESAIKMLKEAATLTPSAAQEVEITKKIDSARERLTKLKAEAK